MAGLQHQSSSRAPTLCRCSYTGSMVFHAPPSTTRGSLVSQANIARRVKLYRLSSSGLRNLHLHRNNEYEELASTPRSSARLPFLLNSLVVHTNWDQVWCPFKFVAALLQSVIERAGIRFTAPSRDQNAPSTLDPSRSPSYRDLRSFSNSTSSPSSPPPYRNTPFPTPMRLPSAFCARLYQSLRFRSDSHSSQIPPPLAWSTADGRVQGRACASSPKASLAVEARGPQGGRCRNLVGICEVGAGVYSERNFACLGRREKRVSLPFAFLSLPTRYSANFPSFCSIFLYPCWR